MHAYVKYSHVRVKPNNLNQKCFIKSHNMNDYDSMRAFIMKTQNKPGKLHKTGAKGQCPEAGSEVMKLFPINNGEVYHISRCRLSTQYE